MAPLLALLPLAEKVFERIFPDKEKADAAKLELVKLHESGELARMEKDNQLALGRMEVIKSEAASGHWLAANWRPLTMLIFTGLIVARWFGWAAPNLSEAEYLKLWSIVELGLGGYVIGRSVEKIAPSVLGALQK